MHVCVCVLVVYILDSAWIFFLLRPSARVLRCLGVISGAGGLLWCLDFSCVCTSIYNLCVCVCALSGFLLRPQ